jgi:DNA-binding CsgD family transcriptional regulator/predicted enzyme related to lactoylglutathione lyase
MKTSKPRGRPPHPDLLTPAEWRVVSLAQHGLTNAQIAEKLQVSINAIKYHISNVIGKLQTIPQSGVSDKKSLLEFLGAPKDSPYHRSQIMDNQLAIVSVGQISRNVNDIEQSVVWYRDVLGLTHLYTYGQLAFFDIDGVRLFLSKAEDSKEPTKTDSIIYFQTNDIKHSHQKLMASGIEFSHAPHKVHTHEDGSEEWMAFFNDPEGRPLGLMGQFKHT